ncbi:MAG TPA: hypothetical protein DEB40_04640 [Elusimicrobia bacterium]|nr:hypothetical protein [Elusimicrobiota bacterium]HBT61011.1 hypothetical protein [Elusimicrobiota bacterium]
MTWRAWLAASLSSVILLLSPGPEALAGAARAVSSAKALPASGTIQAVRRLDFVTGLSAAASLGRLDLKAPGLAPSSLPRVSGLSARPAAPAASESAAASFSGETSLVEVGPAAALPESLKASVAEKDASSADSSLETLKTGVEDLQEAQAPAQKESVLHRIFSGLRRAPVEQALPPEEGLGAAPASGLVPARVLEKAAPQGPAVPVPDYNKKGLWAFFITNTLGRLCFILTSIAYPFVAIPALGGGLLGRGLLGTLLALGPLAGILGGPLSGIIADRLSVRNSMVINMVLRSVLSLVLPAFAWLGILNFWTLLIAGVANGFMLSSFATTDGATLRRLAGSLKETFTAFSSLHYVGIQVLFGLVLGIGAIVDNFNPLMPFLLSALVNGLINVALLWFFMPNDPPQAVNKPSFNLLGKAYGWLGKYWKELLIVAGAVASYVIVQSPLPIAAAFFYWVLRTDTARNLRAGVYREVSPREKEIAERLAELEKSGGSEAEIRGLKAEAKKYQHRQFVTLFFHAVQAVLTFPLQNYALPLMALALVGATGKALLLGQLLGAIFFGNLVSVASRIRLPEIKLPFIRGKVAGQRIVQAGVLVLAAALVFVILVPGSFLAAAAAVAVAAGLMWATGHISNRDWIKFLGLGLAGIWLPYLAWTMPAFAAIMSVKTALFLSLLLYGMFTGPATVSFNAYLQANTPKEDMGKVYGVGSSFFNTFNSFGYGLLALAAGQFALGFPALLLPICIAFTIGGLLFWLAPRHMPGLPDSVLKKPPTTF